MWRDTYLYKFIQIRFAISVVETSKSAHTAMIRIRKIDTNNLINQFTASPSFDYKLVNFLNCNEK